MLAYRYSVYFIFETYFASTNISAKWILHILTDDQNRARVQTAEQLLTMFPNINQKLLLVTKDGFTILN